MNPYNLFNLPNTSDTLRTGLGTALPLGILVRLNWHMEVLSDET